MQRPARPPLRALILAAAFLGAALAFARADDPPVPPQVKTLAEALAAAPDDAARDALLAAAALPAPESKQLRHLLALAQQRAHFGGDIALDEALARYGVALADRAGEPMEIHAAEARLGDVHRVLGEFTEALALFTPALAYFENQHDIQRTVSAAMGRGIVYIYQADYARALADFQHALTLSEANGYRDGAIPALNSIGEVFREQGEPAKALEYYARARAWLGDDTAWNNTFIFNNIGLSYLALGDLDKAIDYLTRAGAIAEKTNQKPRAATALAALGDVYRQRKQPGEARTCLERSLALSREAHDAAGEGRAQLGLAEAARARGDHQAALALAEQAAASYRRANQPAGLGAALTALGHEQRVLAHPAEARAAFEEAIAVTEAVRGRLAGGDLEAQAYFEGKVSPYQEIVALLAHEPGGAEAALQTAERAKARVLLDIVRRGTADTGAVLTPAERMREGELTRRLAALNRRVTVARAADQPAPGSPQPGDAEQPLRQARADWDRFQQDLLAAHPELARQRPASLPLTPADTAGLTDGKDTALLEFVVTDDTACLLVVTGTPESGQPPATVKIFPVAISRDELTRRVEAFRNALAERSLGWQEQARSLYDDLLQGSAPVWSAASHLVIVPDGPLWNLPFQALAPSAERCLWQDHAVSYAPSLTFLQRSAGGPPLTEPPRLLAFGNPSLGTSTARPAAEAGVLMSDRFVPLPEAEKQLAAFAELYPAASYHAYVGAAAHENVFKREAGNFDILHLATHGTLNDQNPLYSYLLMAQTDLAPDEDGLLEARELMGLHLRARLAVLSACETGRGRVGAGEGLLGLSWALFSAGCPAVVVSQWKVDSASTTELMIAFHRRLLAGDAPAQALRAAGLELAKNPKYRHHGSIEAATDGGLEREGQVVGYVDRHGRVLLESGEVEGRHRDGGPRSYHFIARPGRRSRRRSAPV